MYRHAQIFVFSEHHAFRGQFSPRIRLRLHVQPLGEYEGSGATMEPPSVGDHLLPSSLVIIVYYGGLIYLVYYFLIIVSPRIGIKLSAYQGRVRAIVLKCTFVATREIHVARAWRRLLGEFAVLKAPLAG